MLYAPLFLVLGIAITLLIAAALITTYLLACRRPARARLLETALPVVGTLAWATAIALAVGGNDGWLLAGIAAPLLFAGQWALWQLAASERTAAEGAERPAYDAPADGETPAQPAEPSELERAGDEPKAGAGQGERDDAQLEAAATVAEAAETLAISPATVRRWQKRGLLREHPDEQARLLAADVELVAAQLGELRAEGIAASRWARELAARLDRPSS